MKRKIAIICSLLLTTSCIGTINTQASSKYMRNHAKYELTVGSSVQLKVKAQSKVKWHSENKKVATVSSKGVVKAKRVGTATIIAKVKKKKLSCKIRVRKKETNPDNATTPTQLPVNVTMVGSGSAIETGNCIFQVAEANYAKGVLTTKVVINNMRMEEICVGMDPQFYKWNTSSNQWDIIHNTAAVASAIRGVQSNSQFVERFRCASNSEQLGIGRYKLVLNDILDKSGNVLYKNVELEFNISE